MNFISKNKVYILYAICAFGIVSLFMPWFSISSSANVSSDYVGSASSSLNFSVKGMDVKNIYWVPLICFVSAFLVFKNSAYTKWSFLVMAIIAISYIIVGNDANSSMSSHSDFGNTSVSGKANTSPSFGLLLFLIASVFGFYVRHSFYNENGTVEKLKQTYKLLNITFYLSISFNIFMIYFLFTDEKSNEDIIIGIAISLLFLLLNAIMFLYKKSLLYRINNFEVDALDLNSIQMRRKITLVVYFLLVAFVIYDFIDGLIRHLTIFKTDFFLINIPILFFSIYMILKIKKNLSNK
jgi:hypothetical protein